MWSFGHLLFIVSPIIFTVALHYYTKRYTFEQKRTVGVILSVLAIVLLLLRNIEIWVRKDFAFDHEMVPFQVCHFANFVLLFAFVRKSDVAFSMAFTLNLLAAFLSILFADGLENYSSLINFRGIAYIFGHILIVVITLWAFFNDFIFIKFKTYVKSVIFVEAMIIISVLVNNGMFKFYGKYSNYFYTEHPEGGTPLEIPWNMGREYIYNGFKINYMYVIILMLIFPIITYVLYTIAKIFKRAE